jgi:hypothetical protein
MSPRLWLAKHPRRRHPLDPPQFGWLEIAAGLVFVIFFVSAVVE